MNLEALGRRIEHEQGAERDDAEVAVLALDGQVFDTVLSLNWDDENDRWVIICE